VEEFFKSLDLESEGFFDGLSDVAADNLGDGADLISQPLDQVGEDALLYGNAVCVLIHKTKTAEARRGEDSAEAHDAERATGDRNPVQVIVNLAAVDALSEAPMDLLGAGQGAGSAGIVRAFEKSVAV
jgi:hypothetical protein